MAWAPRCLALTTTEQLPVHGAHSHFRRDQRSACIRRQSELERTEAVHIREATGTFERIRRMPRAGKEKDKKYSSIIQSLPRAYTVHLKLVQSRKRIMHQ